MTAISIKPGAMTLSQMRAVHASKDPVSLAPDAWPGIEAAAATVEAVLASDDTVYGVNTGFGRLASTAIPNDKLTALQRNLVLSHAVGTGPDLSPGVVRLAMALKINSLGRGHSGVRRALVERLIAMLEQDLLPCLPAKGSVGASGDLAPLAHLAACLIGIGRARLEGEEMAALTALERAGLGPLELAPKEGLALLNGTQVSTALALDGLFGAERLFAGALVAGTMSVDAAMGSDTPFDPRIHDVSPHQGQRDVAAAVRGLLSGSAIRQSHIACAKVQDPYCLRCQPQVMGACLAQLRAAAATLENEGNAVSDNPLIFPDDGAILSGGNFHAEHVAFAADTLALAIAEIGALAERRIAMLIDATLSGLPPFLVDDPGLNSGFMVAHVTAAALASENKQRATPASVDSLPTSANQEDHVSMATNAARRLGEMTENAAGIVAIELLAAAQGIEFHTDIQTSPRLAEALAKIRAAVPRYDTDRYFAPDIAAMTALVRTGGFVPFAKDLLPSY